MPSAYLCPALDELRAEVNHRWPDRTGGPVGWIGDAAHQWQGSASDHNPDGNGEVHAIDVPIGGIDPYQVVRAAVSDRRAAYVIHNRVIWSRAHGMQARAYTGSNPHTDHVHISSLYGPPAEDRASWGLSGPGSAPAPPSRPAPSPAPQRAPTGTQPGARVLRLASPYMAGPDVAWVQRFIGQGRCGAPDGIYGPHTAGGVRWYQRMRGVQEDGIVGPITWAQLLSHG